MNAEPPTSSLLSQLNEQQAAAADHFTGPALVIAGAGSGKTRTLIYRIAQRFTLRAQSGGENALDMIWSWRW